MNCAGAYQFCFVEKKTARRGRREDWREWNWQIGVCQILFVEKCRLAILPNSFSSACRVGSFGLLWVCYRYSVISCISCLVDRFFSYGVVEFRVNVICKSNIRWILQYFIQFSVYLQHNFRVFDVVCSRFFELFAWCF